MSCNAFICVFKLGLLVNFVVHSSQERVQHGLQFSVAQSFFRQQINSVTLVQWQRKRLLAILYNVTFIHYEINFRGLQGELVTDHELKVCVLVIQCFIMICNHNNCMDKDSMQLLMVKMTLHIKRLISLFPSGMVISII